MTIPHRPFLFIRHGETDWNRSNRIMGQTDIPLNENGIAQAYEAKKHLKDVRFEKIYSSPLQRARQTAEIINEEKVYLIDYNDHLKERGWGKGEGQFDEPISDFKGIELSVANLPEGAENYETFEERVIKALKEILKDSTEQTPLVVAHGGVFRVMTKLLANTTLSAENCALYLFRPPEHPSAYWFIENLNGAI